MKKYLSVAFILLLALVMGVSAASLFTVTEVEAAYTGYIGGRVEPGEGFAPGTNAQFWFIKDTFTTSADEYEQHLPIGATSYDYYLGRNTIQEYYYDSGAKTYVVSVHPQFFSNVIPPDYDDQVNAYYIMNITEILVHDPNGGKEVDCFEDGVAIIPDAFLRYNAGNTPYFECTVFAKIADVRTGAKRDAAWNGDTILLKAF